MKQRGFVRVLVLAALLSQSSKAADRYVAWLVDGTRLTAPSLAGWPIPGASFRLGERELMSGGNPVRLVRDRHSACVLSPPYIVLANGDILGGAPVGLEPDLGRFNPTARVRVQLESPLAPLSGTAIAIATDRIQRVVIAPESAGERPVAGTVVLSSGRRIAARSIRWRESGLALLTAEGIVEAAYGDIAEAAFPGVDVSAAVLEDNLWAGESSGGAIARFHTTSGSVLTASRVSREQEPGRRRGRLTSAEVYYVQPAWADQPLVIPEPEIVSVGYRDADEAPLTLLKSETIASRSVIGPPSLAAFQPAASNLLAAANRESDIGLAARAHSEIAFELPAAAKGLHLAAGLDRAVGDGGCVRCKVISKQNVLWDSGVIQGKDGTRDSGLIDVAGAKGVVLVTEMAHDERPLGADPLDIRDSAVWLAPLVKLDRSRLLPNRPLAMLPGVTEWQLTGDAWKDLSIGCRWNVPASSWDPVLTVGQGAELKLTRKLRVTRASDVVELLTVCPVDLDEHDFTLSLNGEVVPWHNNADRNQLRQWTLRYSRLRATSGQEQESNLTDRLAYWWDLSRWRGQEVTLELTLRGRQPRNEIAWRCLSVRSAIGNLPDSGRPIVADVLLTSLTPSAGTNAGEKPAVLFPRKGQDEPIRLLGQEFPGSIGLARSSSISYPLKLEYRKFVAVVGCTMQMAGPVQVLIDDRVAWERSALGSLTPAEQIEITIPPGAKTLTLRSGSEGLYYGTAAFAEAGFVTGGGTPPR